MLRMALAVLSDGKARDVATIYAEGTARGLVRPTTKPQTMYASLERYVIHTRMLGRRPLIVLDQHRHFRLNQPPDDWPDPLVLPTRPAVPNGAALVARLRATGKGEDPDAFEVAVRDAFAALGFIATHIGGRGAPDGTLDAPLGPLAYHAMLECKTWSGVHRPPHEIAEAAKYRDDFKAGFCLIVAPMISEYETEIVSELATHKVSAWTIDDIAQLLDADVDPYELRPALAPGFAADYPGGVLWERRHGAAKRVAVATELLWRIGWEQQRALTGATDAPHLTEDAAMLLVDQALRAANAMVSVDRPTIGDRRTDVGAARRRRVRGRRRSGGDRPAAGCRSCTRGPPWYPVLQSAAQTMTAWPAGSTLRSVGFRPEADEPITVVGIGIEVQARIANGSDIATK